jgi:hypothetical protein
MKRVFIFADKLFDLPLYDRLSAVFSSLSIKKINEENTVERVRATKKKRFIENLSIENIL